MFAISLNCTCFVKVIEAFPPKFRTFATKLDPQPLVGRNGAWSEQDKLEIFLTLIVVIWDPSTSPRSHVFHSIYRNFPARCYWNCNGRFCVPYLYFDFLSFLPFLLILPLCCTQVCEGHILAGSFRHAVNQIELRVKFAWMNQGTELSFRVILKLFIYPLHVIKWTYFTKAKTNVSLNEFLALHYIFRT